MVRTGFSVLERALELVRRDAGPEEEEALVSEALGLLSSRPHQLMILMGWISLAWRPFTRGPGSEVSIRVVDEDGQQIDPETEGVSPALVCYGRIQAAVLAEDPGMATALWNTAVKQGYAGELMGLALIGSARQIVGLERRDPLN